MHPLHWHAHHLGDCAAQRKDALAVRPHRELAVAKQAHRARRADGAMHLIGTVVRRLERGRAEARSIAVEDDGVLRGQVHEVRVDVALRQRGFAPRGAIRERAHRLDRLVLLRSDHRDVAAVAHDLQHSRQALGGAGVERAQLRPGLRRAHHARMDHVGQSQVLDVARPARDLAGNVDARDVLAHETSRAHILELRLGLRAHVEVLAGDELRIRDAPAAFGMHRAVSRRQLPGRHAKAPRRLRDQQLPHLRRCMQDRRAAILERIAARGVALVGRALGVGGDERDALERNGELLGGDLLQRSLHALPQLRLAGEDGDAAVGADADPRVELGRSVEGARQLRRLRLLRAGGEELASRKDGAHALPFINCAARPTARRIRMCVPQRHSPGESALRMSSSDAPGFFSSNAWARIIIPGMQ